MALRFVEHPDVIFKRAPLTAVLSQVRFSPILALLTEAGATGFQALMRDEYPNFEKSLEANVALSDSSVKVERRAPVFRFSSADNLWRVSLAVDFVALETPSYTNFEEFLQRMAAALDAVHRTLRPSASVRIGLRKVNEVHLESGAEHHRWREVVNPELLGAVGHAAFPVSPDFAFCELRFPDQGNVLAVRHGLHPDKPDTYVIDQDYFSERPYEVDAALELTRLLQHFSDGMTSFFHWALTEQFKQSLGPTPRIRKEATR